MTPRKRPPDPGATGEPVFYTVGMVAGLFGMSEMTLYRAISAGEFPAIRVRGRLIIPAQAVNAMVTEAVQSGALVDAASWGPLGKKQPSSTTSTLVDRPRPGANQAGAGSPTTQQGAGRTSA